MRAHAAALAVAFVAAGFGTASHAQVGGLRDVGPATGVDTPYTPVPKDPPDGMFTQVAGVKFNDRSAPAEKDLVTGSVTPVKADLYAVGFRTKAIGFAGGALDAKPASPGRPAVYRYTEQDGWREDSSFASSGKGFVSEIAWIDDDRALAVGGDGTYPDREKDDGSSTCQGGDPPPANSAGMARAWLYESGKGWRELRNLTGADEGSVQDEVPDAMTALTALDFLVPDPSRPLEFGAAGGLCQIWHWHDGGFLRDSDGDFADPHSNATTGLSELRFRVRSVAFVEATEDVPPASRHIEAFAVTAGCCAGATAGGVTGNPQTFRYSPDPSSSLEEAVRESWALEPSQDLARVEVDNVAPIVTPSGMWSPQPDSFVSVTATRDLVLKAGSRHEPEVLGPGRIASPAGPFSETEPPSHVGARSVGYSSARLLDGDGDIGGGEYLKNRVNVGAWQPRAGAPLDIPVSSAEAYTIGPFLDRVQIGAGGDRRTGPDGIPDWSVGELSSTGQAIAFATDPGQIPAPESAAAPPPDYRGCEDSLTALQKAPAVYGACTAERASGWAGALVNQNEDPAKDSKRIAPATASYKLLRLPSYRLNEIEMLDADGIGWAVGQYGAIVKLTIDGDAGSRNRAGEPEPAELGSPDPAAMPERTSSAPESTSSSGSVPSLSQRPTERLPEPRMVNAASVATAEDFDAIVMSRDGGEGWAFGEDGGFLHYDGGGWRPCDEDTTETGGDEACRSARELTADGAGFRAPARVPLERDGDPANDDAFELVALGGPRGIVRYRNGRWQPEDVDALAELGGRIDEKKAPAISIAFTAPSDGWILYKRGESAAGGSADVQPHRFLHFDGDKWSECRELQPDQSYIDHCDPTGRLPGIGVEGNIFGLRAAGDRLYGYGNRYAESGGGLASVFTDPARRAMEYPVIVFRERGDSAWSKGSENPIDGEYDPGFAASADPSKAPNEAARLGLKGTVRSLGVAARADGRYEGWATGTRLLRLSVDGRWRRFKDPGAVGDNLPIGAGHAETIHVQLDGDRPASAVIGAHSGTTYAFHPQRERWELFRHERPQANWQGSVPAGSLEALAPDGRGGLWAKVDRHFFHFTDSPRRPVFSEAPQPSRRLAARRITALEGLPDGTVWAATDSDTLYRYSRGAGWDSVRVHGWDPGRVITLPSAASSVALEPGGTGIVVGKRGRIAQIDGDTVRLDPAAGRSCALGAAPPCGTGRDLLAAAVAGSGSAVAVGEARTVLWRPAGQGFRAIEPPPEARTMSFTAVALDRSGDILLATAGGRIYRGFGPDGGVRWQLEHDGSVPIRGIATSEEGRRYAVGDDGLILQGGAPDGEAGWKRIDTQLDENLTVVALPAGGGEGALIGGEQGVILTLTDQTFEIARPADFPGDSSTIRALAYTPGLTTGEAEAWAMLEMPRSPQAGQLLHHSSDPENPLLSPSATIPPIPDTPARRDGEVALAAFGKSNCQLESEGSERCPPMGGVTEFAETISARIVDELASRARRGDAPAAALFTGDIPDSADFPGNEALRSAVDERSEANLAEGLGQFVTGSGGSGGPQKLRRWGEMVADRLTDRGVPVFGAIGGRDLPETRACDIAFTGSCVSSNEATVGGRSIVQSSARANENTSWRQAMALRSKPWGGAPQPKGSGIEMRPVNHGALATRHQDRQFDADGEGIAPTTTVALGGAPTHYAIDLVRGRQKVARLIFLDSSLGSLGASDPIQQPVEPDGGQMAWLEQMLCFRGDIRKPTMRCNREPEQQAIVVSNTPTYSYGPGAGEHTAADGAALESVLMAGRANLVVSGRIGWNGLYWTTAPGVHYPCPGGSYPDSPPAPGPGLCGQGGQLGSDPVGDAATELGEALGAGASAPVATAQGLASTVDTLDRPIPFVVASGAGGKFDTDGEANEGFWYGYTVARLDASGDPRKTIIEQRPIYDWVAIEAAERVIRPGQRMTLRGFARSPVGALMNRGAHPTARYDRVDGPAVTHRYDLLEADAERPWTPRTADDGSPVPLDPAVATVDSQTGAIRAGRGNHPRIHAIAMLSVGDHVATYPLAFEPRRTFQPKPLAQQAQPARVVVQSAIATLPSTPPPSSPPQVGALAAPPVPNLQPPSPPPAAPPTAAPQAPPPPPPPPAPNLPVPLDLQLSAPGLAVSPPSSVIPPPAPPINPAPPGGARREARQRQAATEKSGSDSGANAEQHGVDMADGPPTPTGSNMTARARTRAEPSFTALARPEQPSAWARGTLYGGGLLLASLALAGGWTARPRSRPRPPAAPAVARIRD